MLKKVNLRAFLTKKHGKRGKKTKREREKRKSDLTVKFRERNCDEEAAVHLDQQMTDHISAGHLSPAAV